MQHKAPSQKAPKNQKELGLFSLIALITGNMIGAGIFLLPSPLARIGTISLFGWIITAGGALCLAHVFATLSRHFTKTGGPYTYCHEAYGDFVGFLVAYNYWIAIWVGNAAITVAMVGYLSVFFPGLMTSPNTCLVIALGVLWMVTLINVKGLRAAAITQMVTAIMKLVPLFLLIIVGFTKVHFVHYHEYFNISGKSNLHAINLAVMITLWAFIGLESATVPSEHVKNPKKTIFKATFCGVVITSTVYILAVAIVMGIVPLPFLARSGAPFAVAARAIFGDVGGFIIAVGAIVSCLGALNGWVLLQGQVPMAAARDGVFPKQFAKESKQSTPYWGLIFSSILVTLLLVLRFSADLVGTFTFIILLATLSSLIPYLLTTMAELLLLTRGKKGHLKPHILFIALLAFAYTFWAIMGANQSVVYYGFLLTLTGVPVYVWIRTRPSHD